MRLALLRQTGLYRQPLHRYCQDLRDLGLPVLPGTIADGLQTLAPLFQPVVDALYQQRLAQWQQGRPLFEQNAAFGQALQAALGNLHDEAARAQQDTVDEGKEETNAPAVFCRKALKTGSACANNGGRAPERLAG